MADTITPKGEIKGWFVTGAKPTQAEFAAWMDSYWHKSETMNIANVTSLQDVLNTKASQVQVTADLASKVDKVDGKDLSTNDFTDTDAASLTASSIDFINYNKGGNGGDEFLRNGDSVFIDLKADSETGFDPTTKKGLICFSLEAVEDEDDSSATVDFGEEYVKLRWTDSSSTVQTRYLYSNTGGTNAPGVKLKLKDIWGYVCLAYFVYDWSGVCILISAISNTSTSSSSGTAETITLNATTTTYSISADTASMIKLNATTTGCSVTLPTDLTADKSVTFLIPDSSKAITIDGTTYQPGDTVFCVWDNDEQTWSVNNTIQPTVTDYTDVTVKYALTSSCKSYKTTTSRGFKIYQPDTTVAKGDLVAVLSRVNYYGDVQYDATYGVEQGLYYVADKETANATSSYCWIKQIAKGTTLQIVNATTYNAGVWDKTYPGATNSLVTFERLADKANKTDVNTALATKADLVSGLIPAAQLPSYVDDVIEGIYTNATTFTVSGTAITLETGKIYISTDTNSQYRWSGTALIKINISDLSGYVDLTTTQTISGIKTFSGEQTYANNIQPISTSLRLGKSFDGNSSTINLFSDGEFVLLNILNKPVLNSDSYGILRLGTPDGVDYMYPSADSTYIIFLKPLVSSSNITSTGFIVNNGTASQFLKADGSLDSNTYLTSSSLSNYVDLTTNQVVAGRKVFSGTLTTDCRNDLTERIGDSAGSNLGICCVALGNGAARTATGQLTVAVGRDSAYYVSGDSWTAIGSSAGFSNGIGSNWVALGYLSGTVLTETGTRIGVQYSNSAYIGANTHPNSTETTITNENVFGYAANGMGSNTVSLGNSSCTGLYFAGNKFIDNSLNITANTGTFTSGISTTGNVQFTLGSDAAGDIFYRGSDGYLKKLAKGSDGQVLTLAAGLPSWETIATAPSLAINKTSANGVVSLQLFSYPSALKVSAVTVMSNASNISVQIGSTTYDKDSLLNVVLPANTELSVLDVITKAGYNTGSAIITFSKA